LAGGTSVSPVLSSDCRSVGSGDVMFGSIPNAARSNQLSAA
jgi:hypothetical protein